MNNNITGVCPMVGQSGGLSKLPNIGKVLEAQLHEAGIFTPEQLREIGGKEAFIRVRLNDSGACLHMLYALEGAVEGIRYTQLPEESRQDLKHFFNSL